MENCFFFLHLQSNCFLIMLDLYLSYYVCMYMYRYLIYIQFLGPNFDVFVVSLLNFVTKF